MAKTVLLLDDDLQFRRMIVPALEERGLRVLQAGKASEAQRILATDAVDLAVVDGLLPDTSGVQWIESLRVEGNKLVIIFVSAFWRDLESYKRLTQELDVALVAYKPIMPDRFAAQVESLLGGRRTSLPPGGRKPTPLATPMVVSQGEQSATSVPDELKAAYLRSLPEALEELRHAVERAVEGDEGALLRVRARAHDLAGTAGSFGLGEVGEVAGRMESAVMPLHIEADGAGFWSVPDDALPDVPETTRGPGASGSESFVAPAGLLSPRVLLVDDDPVFVDYMVDSARHQLIDLQTATTFHDAMDRVTERRPDVAFVGVPFGRPDRSLELIERLHREWRVPVGAISLDDGVEARVGVTRSGAALFLAQPVDAEGLATAIRQLQTSDAIESVRVAVLSDHQEVGDRAVAALCEAGMLVTVLEPSSNPLSTLEECQPDAVIIDLVVGTTRGVDLCRMLRATPRWHDLAIFLVGSDSDRSAAIAAGADDCVTALEDPAWSGTIRARLQRLRRMLHLADRDRLTRLPLRSILLPALAARFSEARRHRRRLSVALLDVDDLHTINERHGYLGGDRVLAGLASLIVGRFRLEDLRGRIGPDEFMIVFPGARADHIAPVLSRAQREFSMVPFSGIGGTTFHASFSAGLASFPDDGLSIPGLLAVAEKRLRNRG